jgi:hypothetical protein
MAIINTSVIPRGDIQNVGRHAQILFRDDEISSAQQFYRIFHAIRNLCWIRSRSAQKGATI